MFSYTLHVQSSHYTRNRSSRVFLCAASPDESGSQALDWALSELVRDGDELIVFRGVEKEELGERFLLFFVLGALYINLGQFGRSSEAFMLFVEALSRFLFFIILFFEEGL